jgi:hypothetical protein
MQVLPALHLPDITSMFAGVFINELEPNFIRIDAMVNFL